MLPPQDNDTLKNAFTGKMPCFVYLQCNGRLIWMTVNRQGVCCYFALANAFDVRLRPETIKINGKRLPVFDGEDPEEGRFYLLTPEEMEQLRFHHYNDPAIATGDPDDDPFSAFLRSVDMHMPDLKRHIGTACSHTIANLQKSESPLLQDLGKLFNGWMYRVTGRGVDSTV